MCGVNNNRPSISATLPIEKICVGQMRCKLPGQGEFEHLHSQLMSFDTYRARLCATLRSISSTGPFVLQAPCIFLLKVTDTQAQLPGK